jgi:hypothetical protein
VNPRENFEQPSRSTGPGSLDAADERPRVVIFDDGGEPTVEIIDLLEAAFPGDVFCHCGTRWQVTATRTGNRVLIARPVEA